MKTNFHATLAEFKVTRRDALQSILAGSLVFTTTSNVMSVAATDRTSKSNEIDSSEFVPENDYPYFGWHHDSQSPKTKDVK